MLPYENATEMEIAIYRGYCSASLDGSLLLELQGHHAVDALDGKGLQHVYF